MKNKSTSEKFSGQPLERLKEDRLVQNNPLDPFLIITAVRINANLLLRGWDQTQATVKGTGSTVTKVIRSNNLGITEANLQHLQSLEATRIAQIGEKAKENLNSR